MHPEARRDQLRASHWHDGVVFSFDSLDVPIIAAPMAGGPTTPSLVAAVAASGGAGFLAAGYRTSGEMAEQIRQLKNLSQAPFGVNLFVPNNDPIDTDALAAFADALAPIAERLGVDRLPTPTHDDDDWDAKIVVLQDDPVAMVSFTFGLPGADVVRALHAVGTCVIATVTSVAEAEAAAALDYDALTVQGPEAGGHRGTHHVAATPDDTPLLQLLARIREAVDLPVVAAGGMTTGRAVKAALEHAAAVQLGTAFLLSDEAGTSHVHRAALRNRAFDETTVTRCFTGRMARALHNDFIEAYDAVAPASYPAVHQVTGPLRKAAAAVGDPSYVHLWAGTGWRDIRPGSAADITRELWDEAQNA